MNGSLCCSVLVAFSLAVPSIGAQVSANPPPQGGAPPSAPSQKPAETKVDEAGGALRATLTNALTELSKGNCPDKLLGPLVLDACEQQIAKLKPGLERLGEIKLLRYRGLEQLPTGIEAEVYRVVFANGQSTWVVAASPNGKLTVFFSPG